MTAANTNEDQFAILRRNMVEQVALHADHVGGKTGRAAIAGDVMEAIGRVPRHAFVPVEMALYAYLDSPLPIGCGKTISQPFIVAADDGPAGNRRWSTGCSRSAPGSAIRRRF